jgi:tRNA dimethylallyltransferase
VSSNVVSAVDRAIELARGGKLLVVVGPTASGKTDLAMSVCEAVGGEIVSADSVQVYRGFDIGSGKPTASELERVPHHLVSTHDPKETIDAATWAKLAENAIGEIRARGKIPIVCGGTFFWVRALVLGLVEAPPADPAIRARHVELVAANGRAALHDALARVDPESAKRLHPNDVVRVGRALEVYELSGRPMSAWQAEHGFKARRFETSTIGLRHDMDSLTERIRRRADAWLSSGWLDEVRSLLEAGHGETRAMSSVGYAEVHAHLKGELSRSDLLETIVRATRVFARRQRTWLNHADVEWL